MLQVNYSIPQKIILVLLHHLLKNVIFLLRWCKVNELFDGISEKNRCKILQKLEATTICYSKNNTILLQENIIGIVLYGKVQIIKNDYNGNDTLIDEFIKGEVFDSITLPIIRDEIELLVKEASKITIISFNEILLLKEINDNIYNQFLKNLLLLMSKKMSIRNERIELLVNKTIRDKLLEYFKILSKKQNSKVITLPFTYTELASYLAIDRSAMNRELKNLKDERLIETTGRKIRLLYYI